MSRPHSTEPDSRLLALVRQRFPGLGNRELAFLCRTLSRGHAAHGATLKSAGRPSGVKRRAAYEKARLRAAELALAWADLSAFFATSDINEEHEAGTPMHTLARRLNAEIGRMLFHPDCLTKETTVGDLIPPREHLPSRIAEVLRPLYPSSLPVRSRTRPAKELDAVSARAKAFGAMANAPGTMI